MKLHEKFPHIYLAKKSIIRSKKILVNKMKKMKQASPTGEYIMVGNQACNYNGIELISEETSSTES